jgi:hypothetical protein
MDVHTTSEKGYTQVNVTFTPAISLDWINLYSEGKQIIEVTSYPSEFEIELYASNIEFSSGEIEQGQTYDFSILVEDPEEMCLELYNSFGWIEEPPSNAITLPVTELGNVTVKTDVPVVWEHKPTLPQSIQSMKIEFEEEKVFDTDLGTYPSIAGIHNGTITPSCNISVSKLYTYPCVGTGGHSEHVKIWNESGIVAEAHWNGYKGDWHNITFDKTVVLLANKTYNYTIRTGSYPQIHHTDALPTANGGINCTEFIDATGKRYANWIPAIRLA